MQINLEHSASSWVNDAQGFVLADCTDGTSILVPADAVDQVWVSITQLVHKLPRAHVPHTNHIITACERWQHNIQRRGISPQAGIK